MFVPGSEAAEFLEGVKEKQVQHAGVDLTVDALWTIEEEGELDFSNQNRKVPEGKPLDFSKQVHLEPGCYVVRYGQKISVPENCMGIVFPRSSLMRMGANLISALWDPGYRGLGKGLLVVFNPKGIILHPGARIGQIAFIKGEASGSYSGTYQDET